MLLNLAFCFTCPVSAQDGSESHQTSPCFPQGEQLQACDPKGQADTAVSDSGQVPADKRVFGVLPNYRTAEARAPFQPLATKQKFVIATKDSIDYPVFLTTAFFAGISQLEHSSNDVYGQSTKGLVHRYGINYADQLMSDYFPEAVIPFIFHEDPRYFRRSEGSITSRAFYAIDHIFIAKTDTGRATFNAPEILGNGLAALAAMSYHPHERTAGDTVSEFGTFVTADMAGNIAKEFWPDLKRWYKNRHH